MTAVIGILNKSAVAIAADSAVTFGGSKKTLNTANKLFTLSKYHPVGIVIYNSADFVAIPWEVLIKEYRRSRGTGFQDTLREYALDFVRYICQCTGLISETKQKEEIAYTASKFFQNTADEVKKKLGVELAQLPKSERTEQKAQELAALTTSQTISIQSNHYNSDKVKPIDDGGLQEYSFDDFLSKLFRK